MTTATVTSAASSVGAAVGAATQVVAAAIVQCESVVVPQSDVEHGSVQHASSGAQQALAANVVAGAARTQRRTRRMRANMGRKVNTQTAAFTRIHADLTLAGRDF